MEEFFWILSTSSPLEVTGEMIVGGIFDKDIEITTAKYVGLYMDNVFLPPNIGISVSPKNQVSVGLYFKLHGE